MTILDYLTVQSVTECPPVSVFMYVL